MKKRLLVLLLTLVCLTGCSNKDKEDNLAKKIDINYNQTSESYVEGEDNQYFFAEINSPVKIDNGYYFIERNSSIINFYDTKQNLTVALCNQPNCNHEDNFCNAYLENFDFEMEYYSGHLYLIGYSKDDSSVWLYRFSTDGSERKKLCKLYSATELEHYCNWTLHRGYVYYTIPDYNLSEHTSKLYRVALEPNAKSEEIFSFDNIGGNISGIKAYGNNVYFQNCTYADLDANGYTGDICKYDIINNNVEVVKKDSWRAFAVVANDLYYDNGSEVMKYNIQTKVENLFYETNMPTYIGVDKDYVYLDNYCSIWLNSSSMDERNIYVVDKNSQVVDTISMTEEYSDCVFGDDYLFVTISNESYRILQYDKSQLGTSNHEWVQIN